MMLSNFDKELIYIKPSLDQSQMKLSLEIFKKGKQMQKEKKRKNNAHN